MYKKVGAVINRLNDPEVAKFVDTGEIPVLAQIPDDPQLALCDVQGKSVMELPDDSNIVLGVQRALKAMEIQ